MKIFKAFALPVLLAALAFSAGCAQLDVIGQTSVTAFDTVLKAAPNQVLADEQNSGWSLSAPDGTARFVLSGNYKNSPVYDVFIEFDAAPFVTAGLDISRLPENYVAHDNLLSVGVKLGEDATPAGNDTLSAYRLLVERYRMSVGYHSPMDHFNIDLGDGNMFEWAKDLSVNTVSGEVQDKDMVFVLNPQPLIDAGLDPQSVTGWTYAAVPAHMGGSEAYKLLKPFDLN